MIRVTSPAQCSGCGACVATCGRGAISLRSDGEGFWYARVDEALCVECGQCERVCPVLHPGSAGRPIGVYAARSADAATVGASSSGGLFSALAGLTLSSGGRVYGARFDASWQVAMGWADTLSELDALRRSKYSQAWPGEVYSDVRATLRGGRPALFSGTPCQTAALRRFLGGAAGGELLVVDVVCAGVPSPLVWRRYLAEEAAAQGLASVAGVNFRHKVRRPDGYAYYFRLSLTDGGGREHVVGDSEYMSAIGAGAHLRPICHVCPFKECRGGSDVTLGDYWGLERLHPALDRGRDTSLVMTHTAAGEAALRRLTAAGLVEASATDYEETREVNSVARCSPRHPRRDKLFAALAKGGSVKRTLRYDVLPPTRLDGWLRRPKDWLRKWMGEEKFGRIDGWLRGKK